MPDKQPPMFSIIEDMIKNIPGWTPPDQLFALFNMIFMNQCNGDILEVGSWCGRSASVLGLAVKMIGSGKVYCVDLFPEKCDWRRNKDGSYSFNVEVDGRKIGAYEKQTVWADVYKEQIEPLYTKNNGIFEIFNKTIKHHNIADVVVPFKGDLDLFMEQMPKNFKCKLAFLDGDHSYEALCQDIKNVEQFLLPGGWICFDDAHVDYEGVNRAIEDKITTNPSYERCAQLTRKLFVARKRCEP